MFQVKVVLLKMFLIIIKSLLIKQLAKLITVLDDGKSRLQCKFLFRIFSSSNVKFFAAENTD